MFHPSTVGRRAVIHDKPIHRKSFRRRGPAPSS
jgi:hypothetical protein